MEGLLIASAKCMAIILHCRRRYWRIPKFGMASEIGRSARVDVPPCRNHPIVKSLLGDGGKRRRRRRRIVRRRMRTSRECDGEQ